MGDGTETRGHAANSDQGLDTHSRAADLDPGAEYVVDEQVGVVQRSDPHAGDAEAQQTQLPEDTATDKEIKSEKAAATDKEIKTEEAGVTDKEIKTEEAGATDKEVKTEKAGATDEKIRTEEAGATDKEIKTEKAGATDEKIRTEEAGGKHGGVKDGGNLDAKGADSQVAKLPEVTTMTKEGKIEDTGDEQVCIKEVWSRASGA
ncbi:hypothetical protein PF003_g15625 [Phytophthora fragariae]|nr:hypothetical protein PF003_g15625 [Phytophthora fragariae]